MRSWKETLSDEQRAATAAAARLIEDAGMQFVIIAFAESGLGAIVSSLLPPQSAAMIEKALAAAQGAVAVEEINDRPQ
jgi:hypothetical protein